MTINQNINLSGQVKVADTEGQNQVVAYLSANIDTANFNVTFTVSMQNNDLAAANISSVQEQYTEFETAVKVKAKELGYVIFSTDESSTTENNTEATS